MPGRGVSVKLKINLIKRFKEIVSILVTKMSYTSLVEFLVFFIWKISWKRSKSKRKKKTKQTNNSDSEKWKQNKTKNNSKINRTTLGFWVYLSRSTDIIRLTWTQFELQQGNHIRKYGSSHHAVIKLLPPDSISEIFFKTCHTLLFLTLESQLNNWIYQHLKCLLNYSFRCFEEKNMNIQIKTMSQFSPQSLCP